MLLLSGFGAGLGRDSGWGSKACDRSIKSRRRGEQSASGREEERRLVFCEKRAQLSPQLLLWLGRAADEGLGLCCVVTACQCMVVLSSTMPLWTVTSTMSPWLTRISGPGEEPGVRTRQPQAQRWITIRWRKGASHTATMWVWAPATMWAQPIGTVRTNVHRTNAVVGTVTSGYGAE